MIPCWITDYKQELVAELQILNRFSDEDRGLIAGCELGCTGAK
jgi:hypothetical protein